MNDFHEMSCFLGGLSGCELIALAAIIAISISQNLSNEEINILGNFFSAIDANLSTIAAANQ